MESYPHTYESDFSTYDATNGIVHRQSVDETLFEMMYEKKIIIPYKSEKTTKKQYDRYYTSNVYSDFSFGINARGIKGSLLRGKGRLRGTTYSGHPTCTTLCGTLRNLMYHLFSIYRSRHMFSFEA